MRLAILVPWRRERRRHHVSQKPSGHGVDLASACPLWQNLHKKYVPGWEAETEVWNSSIAQYMKCCQHPWGLGRDAGGIMTALWY